MGKLVHDYGLLASKVVSKNSIKDEDSLLNNNVKRKSTKTDMKVDGIRRARTIKKETPWSEPPNPRFPRSHLWSWEDERDEEFEKEFEQTTNMVLASNRAFKDEREDNKNNKNKNSSKKYCAPPSFERKFGSFLKSPRQLREEHNSRSAIKPQKSLEIKKGLSMRKTSLLFSAESSKSITRNGQSGVLLSNEDTDVLREEEEHLLKKEEEEEEEAEKGKQIVYSNLETPTPPLVSFGIGEDILSSEDDLSDLEEEMDGDDYLASMTHDLLLEKQKFDASDLTPLKTFIDACYESSLLPEPLLASKRNRTKDTMESSKLYTNLEIRTKADIEKQNTRDIMLISWKDVAKIRVPDELKLDHYGMGDEYMPAFAKGLQIDALNAKHGKRAFQRLNLSSCRISGKGLTELARGIKDHCKIRSINLANNQLGPCGLSPLCQLFTSYRIVSSKIRAIDLSGNGLCDLAIIELFQGLRESSVTWLNLSKNQIGASGALEIAKFIQEQEFDGSGGGQDDLIEEEDTLQQNDNSGSKHISRLRTLILDWNKIRGLEATKLVHALEENRMITEVSLAWNAFGSTPETIEAIIKLITCNKVIKVLSLAHNLFSKVTCEEILEAVGYSTSLVSFNLSGNEPHDNIFAKNGQVQQLHKLSEAWPEDSMLSECSHLYTRYSCRESKKQQRLSMASRKASSSVLSAFRKKKSSKRGMGKKTKSFVTKAKNHLDNMIEKTNQKRNGDEKMENDGGVDVDNNLEQEEEEEEEEFKEDDQTIVDDNYDAFDGNIWKKRGLCWVKHRWTKQTIWYFPGISGPPSKDIFVVFSLPGGTGMCAKMKFVPEDQPSNDWISSSGRMQTATERSQSKLFLSQQRSILQKKKYSSKFLLGSSNSGLKSSGTKRNLGMAAPPKFGSIKNATGTRGTFAGFSSSRSPTKGTSKKTIIGRLPNHHSDGQKDQNEEDYNYKDLEEDENNKTMVGEAIMDSIRRQQKQDREEQIGIARLKEYSISGYEPVCPACVTVMLPPGRTFMKFIVKGKEIFARDQDTCWVQWPHSTKQQNDTKADDKNPVDAQGGSTIANYIDVKWLQYPVCGLANPDPGSERPQPTRPWSINKSIFRYHHCDDVKLLREAFIADWTRIRENRYIVKTLGEDMQYVRELIWANYSDLCTVFITEAATGDGNSFALDLSEMIGFLRENELIPETVKDDLLKEVHANTFMVEAQRGVNPFGKHYYFMVKKQASVKKSEEDEDVHGSMIRNQFLQFLIVVAAKVYAPQSRQSILKRKTQTGAKLRGPPLPAKTSIFKATHFDNAFDAVHHFLELLFNKHATKYIHRDVFRRGVLFFQDVVNVFSRHMEFLRKLFDKYSVKGHVLHDFIPSTKWEQIFHKVNPGYAKLPLKKIFALSKCTFIDFDDPDFTPGLCFLEFLECLARLARFNSMAHNVVNVFRRTTMFAGNNRNRNIQPKKKSKENDEFANELEELILLFQSKLTDSI